LQAGMSHYDETFDAETRRNIAGKFGLAAWRDGESSGDAALVNDVFRLMGDAEIDMTIFFTRLAEVGIDATANRALMAEAFYREDLREQHQLAFEAWLARYVSRIQDDDLAQADRAAIMAKFNPRFVLRNYLAQQAIDAATEGDDSKVIELLDVMRKPYHVQPGRERFAEKRPDWARQKAGCSMLSCSS